MTKRQTIIGAALIAGALAGSVGMGVCIGKASEQASNPFNTACVEEDSNGCVWQGDRQGNGVGQTYVVTHGGNVFYLDASMSADAAHPTR